MKPDRVELPIVTGKKFDIDGDEKVKPLSDGLLILRSLFGFIEGQNSLAANEGNFYQNEKAMQTRLRHSLAFLDIDRDGNVLALTDGLILIRYLFGFTGYQLTAGAISREATRVTPTDIKSYLDKLMIE